MCSLQEDTGLFVLAREQNVLPPITRYLRNVVFFKRFASDFETWQSRMGALESSLRFDRCLDRRKYDRNEQSSAQAGSWNWRVQDFNDSIEKMQDEEETTGSHMMGFDRCCCSSRDTIKRGKYDDRSLVYSPCATSGRPPVGCRCVQAFGTDLAF